MATDATGVLIARRLRRGVALFTVLALAWRRRWRSSMPARRQPRASPAAAGSTSCRSRATSTRPTSRSSSTRSREANERGSTLLVLQVEVVGRDRRRRRRRRPRQIHRSRVPVAVWVGPSGADAKGAATLLLAGGAPRAHLARLGRRSRPAGAARRSRRERRARRSPTSSPRSREDRGRDPGGARRARRRAARLDRGPRRRRDRRRAPDRRRAHRAARRQDGRRPQRARWSCRPPRWSATGRDRRRQPNQEVRFNRLDLGGQVLHRLISPSIAYFLFVAGLALIVFEFYTASIGLAGLVGAICADRRVRRLLAPPGPLVGARAALARDVRRSPSTCRPASLGVWTVIGTVALGVGLARCSTAVRPGSARRGGCSSSSVVGMLLFMLGGMTAMIRARVLHAHGRARGHGRRDGRPRSTSPPTAWSLIRGARWRARTNRATPDRGR